MNETDEQRAEYIKGLRALADALEQHPELILPYTGSGRAGLNVIPLGADEQREQLAAWAKVLPGQKEKSPRDEYFDLIGAFHGVHIKVICDRAEVCERVVTGTREITKEVPDPEALAAVPTMTVTETVEDVEWVCHPILDQAGGAR